MKNAMGIAAVALLAACSGGGEESPETRAGTAAATAPAVATDSAAIPAGMSHDSMPGMRHDSAGGTMHDSAGHDSAGHDSARGMGRGSSTEAAHAEHGAEAASGASHAAHGATSRAGESHAAHRATTGGATAHSGHGAAQATGPTATVSAAVRKLLELGAELVRDSVVQRRIQQDTTLRRAWSDPDVRRAVGAPR